MTDTPPAAPSAAPPAAPSGADLPSLTGEARRRHWEGVYATRSPLEVSWYQPRPEVSLRLIAHAAVPRTSRILDVGGGASTLVDALLADGYADVAVADIAAPALAAARARLGAAAGRVRWIVADATDWTPPSPVALWHDRAVFHFLTDARDRARYMDALRGAVVPGGTVIIAAFAEDGPARCSGLPVRRTSAAMLAAELGDDFICEETAPEAHRTPGGAVQSFLYARFTRRAATGSPG